MTTEAAILDLSRRAQYAMQKADNAEKQRKADDYCNAVNAVIDYYNRTEKLQDEVRNLQDIIQCLGEYMSINHYDLDALKQIDAKYLRKRMMYWLQDRRNKSDDVFFHNVMTDWNIRQDILQDIKFYSSLTYDIPAIRYNYDLALETLNEYEL